MLLRKECVAANEFIGAEYFGIKHTDSTKDTRGKIAELIREYEQAREACLEFERRERLQT